MTTRIQTTVTGIEEVVLTRRITELGFTNINAYVRYLVHHDLIHYILSDTKTVSVPSQD